MKKLRLRLTLQIINKVSCDLYTYVCKRTLAWMALHFICYMFQQQSYNERSDWVRNKRVYTHIYTIYNSRCSVGEKRDKRRWKKHWLIWENYAEHTVFNHLNEIPEELRYCFLPNMWRLYWIKCCCIDNVVIKGNRSAPCWGWSKRKSNKDQTNIPHFLCIFINCSVMI